MSDRLLPFEAIENFRDYGGYRGADGMVRRGVLFRAGQQANATDNDLRTLGGLGLHTVVDLRSPFERSGQPSRRPDGFAGQVIESELEGRAEAPHLAFLREGELSCENARAFMLKTYRGVPFAPSYLALFDAHFRALEKGSGPSLIHCTAGKDRTGMLAALTHVVLGVSEEDIMADYLATNQAVGFPERAEVLARWLFKKRGIAVPVDAVQTFFGVQPDYLQAAFAEMRSRYGSVHAYLEQALLLDAARVEAIRQRLTA